MLRSNLKGAKQDQFSPYIGEARGRSEIRLSIVPWKDFLTKDKIIYFLPDIPRRAYYNLHKTWAIEHLLS
jgi:hypothetical protein